jgi:hypothetical protein
MFTSWRGDSHSLPSLCPERLSGLVTRAHAWGADTAGREAAAAGVGAVAREGARLKLAARYRQREQMSTIIRGTHLRTGGSQEEEEEEKDGGGWSD